MPMVTLFRQTKCLRIRNTNDWVLNGFDRRFFEVLTLKFQSGRRVLSESGFSGLEDRQDNVCKNTNFHGDFLSA